MPEPTNGVSGFFCNINKVWPILLVALAAMSGWVRVATQARASLSREEAVGIYVTRADYREDKINLDARLIRMDEKLDRLLERQ